LGCRFRVVGFFTRGDPAQPRAAPSHPQLVNFVFKDISYHLAYAIIGKE